MTSNVLNKKIKEIDNEIPELCGLVKKTDYLAKISKAERKYFITSDYNRFTSDIQKELLSKYDISNFI